MPSYTTTSSEGEVLLREGQAVEVELEKDGHKRLKAKILNIGKMGNNLTYYVTSSSSTSSSYYYQTGNKWHVLSDGPQTSSVPLKIHNYTRSDSRITMADFLSGEYRYFFVILAVETHKDKVSLHWKTDRIFTEGGEIREFVRGWKFFSQGEL